MAKKGNKSQDDPGNKKIVHLHVNLRPIETTLALDNYCRDDDEIVKHWVRTIKQTYYVNKNSNTRIVLGLSAESGEHYKNGEWRWASTCKRKPTVPLSLLQICVGRHCLFYYANRDGKLPKALTDLFLDDKTVVAAVGMESLAEKLEADLGCKVARPLDLNRQAAVSQGLDRDDFYQRYSWMKLAKAILGEEGLDWDEILMKMSGGSRSIAWWSESATCRRDSFSDEKVNCGTLQAFLAHRMGIKLLFG